MRRPDHQNPDFPVCEGSGIRPVVELGFAMTEPDGAAVCPGCGHKFVVNRRGGLLRKHRRSPSLVD